MTQQLQRATNEVAKCPQYTRPDLVIADLTQFISTCNAVDLSVVGVTETGQIKVNCIQLRGKIPIKVNNKDRPIGFKFILPTQYPLIAPYVYLDEPIDTSVIEMIDYIDKGYRIMSELLIQWAKPYSP